MLKVLLVSDNESVNENVISCLKEAGVNEIEKESTVEKAKAYFENNEVGLVIVNTPLPDVFGGDFARAATSEGITQSVMLVSSDDYNIAEEKNSENGTYIIRKPFAADEFIKLIKLIEKNSKKLFQIKAEYDKLSEKFNVIKVVSRAKCLLVEKEHLSENDAHKRIEKMAMNQRKTRLQIADEILKQYEV